MLGNHTLKNHIERLKKITKVELSLFDKEGSFRLSTLEEERVCSIEIVKEFIASSLERKEIDGAVFYRVSFEGELEYVLVAQGEQAAMIGEIALCQLTDLLERQMDGFDKNSFYQNLLLDNLLLVDIYNKAKRLHIETDIPRIVFLVELLPENGEMAKQLMKGIYGNNKEDFITTVDEKHLILVRALPEKETYEDLEAEANILVDMLNTEAMISARVSYGTIVHEMKEVSKSYKEARMALDVGKIFFTEKKVIPYNTLGIGRLIYQLPLSLCEMFMKEVLGNEKLEELDEETLATIQKFYENNLNISETARQLYVHRNTLVYRLEKLEKLTGLDIRTFEDALTLRIALMVSSYMKYMEKQEY